MTGLVFALMGSGEFEPWSAAVDRWLLDRARSGDGRVLILPTASAPEGDGVFDSWAEKGRAHYRRQGIPTRIVPIKTRADADRSEHVRALLDASVVFFSGGNPAYLADTLRESRFWRALLDALDRGVGYAGCSAGVACLTDVTFDTSVGGLSGAVWKPGLGLARDVVFGPHWDVVETWLPGARDFIVGSVADGRVVVGLDEETALVGDGEDWTVLGRGGIHVYADRRWEHHAAGDTVRVPLAVTARPG